MAELPGAGSWINGQGMLSTRSEWRCAVSNVIVWLAAEPQWRRGVELVEDQNGQLGWLFSNPAYQAYDRWLFESGLKEEEEMEGREIPRPAA